MNDSSKPGKIVDGVLFTTEHTYVKDGIEIRYTCDAQEFIFVDEMEQPEASFFLYSYLRNDAGDRARRPVIFNYGGGPGDASNPLSMWGPKVVDPSYEGCTAPYPEPVDNPNWLIGEADIVCMDPPGAGLGAVYQYEQRGKYWGAQPDALAFIDMLKHWLTKYDRWCSPKYIAGTSYGGIRTAMLADLLCGGPYYTEQRQYAHGIALNGAILSATSLNLDFKNLSVESAGIEASTANFLPTYAAINWHWNREGKPALEAFVRDAERFAAEELLRAQWLGNAMDGAEKAKFLEKYSFFTGLPAPMLAAARNYEIPVNQFVECLLAAQGLRLCLYDGREALPAADTLGFYEDFADDLCNARETFRSAAMVRRYYREFLKISVPREWVEVNFDANAQWTWTSNRSMIQHLESAMRRNPQMHALIYGGLFDLATPVGDNRYALRHSNIDQRRLIVHESANSGHYTSGDPESAKEYSACVRRLIQESI